MNFSCRRIISVVFCVCALLLYIGMHNCQSLKQVNSWEPPVIDCMHLMKHAALFKHPD